MTHKIIEANAQYAAAFAGINQAFHGINAELAIARGTACRVEGRRASTALEPVPSTLLSALSAGNARRHTPAGSLLR